MSSVTAVITTYGREAGIVKRAMDSVFAQSYPVRELLVVDDNKDGSEFSEGIKSLCDSYPNAAYIKQDGNRGSCAARNLGIQHACGEFIAFLDDDDQWLPDKIEKQMQAFENDKSLGLVFCSGIVVDEINGTESDYYNLHMKKDISFEDELGCDYVGSTSNPLIKKKCFDVVGGFWEGQPARQDYEMWLRISKQFKIHGIEGKHFIYNQHGGVQITKDKRKSYAGFRNIYLRYREDYKKYPRARVNILNWILWNREGISLEVLRFCLERQWVQIRHRIPRTESDID